VTADVVYDGDVAAAGQLCIGFASVVQTSACPLAAHYREWIRQPLTATTCRNRRREIFPLPPLHVWPFSGGSKAVGKAAHLIANMCLAALNFLAFDFKADRAHAASYTPPSSTQQSAHQHVAARCLRFAEKLAMKIATSDWWHTGFHKFEASEKSEWTDIIADQVDLPGRAATCNPSSLIPPDLLASVSNPSVLFPKGAACTLKYAKDNMGSQRGEYINLTVKETMCGKLCPQSVIQGAGRVFATAKSSPGHLREIWNGSWLSSMAAAPPAPYVSWAW